MTRPGRSTRAGATGLLLALGVVPLGLALPGTAAHAAESTPTDTPSASPSDRPEDVPEVVATPLKVRLTSLSPGVVPRRGAVVMSGTVSNTSEEPWVDVNVLPFVGDTPLTTRDDLDLAAQTPEETAVGDRIDAPGAFLGLGDLEPGESADFTVRVPEDQLPPSSAPGVYWIGVHALGTNTDGRDAVADGRARTFVPVVDRTDLPDDEVPVSVVLPLRAESTRGADGSLADPEGWVDLSGAEGRLDRISRFALTAGDSPLTWLVDPAVLEALDDLARGNPPLSLGPAERRPDPDAEPSPPADEEPEPSPTPSETADPEPDEAGVPDTDEAAAARTLLRRLDGQLASDDVLGLPYADADAVALLRERPSLLARAIRLSEATFTARDLDTEPVVSPPDGQVDPALLEDLPDDVGLLLSDRGRLDLSPGATVGGREVGLSDARVGAGGPAPVRAADPLSLRQRVLAETLLEAGRAGATGQPARPVVLTLPPSWDPGAAWAESDFFDALQVPWLRLSDLPPAVGDLEDALTYSEASESRELGPANIVAARRLVRQGVTLDELLANVNDVLDRVTGAALGAVSYHVRDRPGDGVAAADGLRRSLVADLQQVGVFGTDFVTLSGGSGTLTVSVVNDLPQPVTVGLDVRSDADVRVEPVEPVELGPEQRVTLPVPVTSDEGVHDVSIVPVTDSGAIAGASYDFVLRTSQVGRTIWYVMAGASALFLFAVLRRVRRRWREGRARRQPAQEEGAR